MINEIIKMPLLFDNFCWHRRIHSIHTRGVFYKLYNLYLDVSHWNISAVA